MNPVILIVAADPGEGARLLGELGRYRRRLARRPDFADHTVDVLLAGYGSAPSTPAGSGRSPP